MKMILSGLLILIAIVVFAFTPKSKTDAETNMTSETGQGIQFIEADRNKALSESKKQSKLIFWMHMLLGVALVNC